MPPIASDIGEDAFFRQTDALIRHYLHVDPVSMDDAEYAEAACQIEWLSSIGIIPVKYSLRR